MRDKEEHILNLEETIKEKDRSIENLEATLRNRDLLTSRLEAILRSRDKYLRRIEVGVTERDRTISDLEATLSRIYDSHGWNVLLLYYEVRNKILPANTLREKAAKSFWNILRHKKLRQRKSADQSGSVTNQSNRPSLSQTPAYPLTVGVETIARKTIEDLKPLEFPIFNDCRVSIIIPVWNKWQYTYNCLRSLLENTEHVAYEVVTVDDGSTDETSQMLSMVKHIGVVKNKKNLGFSKACNEGAKYAKGDYILFLNNDTEVTKGWLDSMVKLIDADETIGAVGAKLVFSDGTLQEAGSIIWSDGLTLCYGRGEDPDAPEFSYIRDVDYCSAACLLIRKDLFVRLGGFDEIYSPAYYEDADLCLGVKSLGYRVVFHPEVKVIHHEFATSTKATAVQLYLSNQGKFAKKWNRTLEKQPPPRPEIILLARDSRPGSRVLIVDDVIPASHLGSGFQRFNLLLKYLAESGYVVTFFPLSDSFPYQPCTRELQFMGIEVFYGKDLNIYELLQGRREMYDVVLVSRPHNASRLLKDLRRYFSKAFIVYDTQGIYASREVVGLNPGEKTITDEEEKMILQELEPLKYADAIIAASVYEKTQLEKYGFTNIFVWGYPLEPKAPKSHFSDRTDLEFLAGTLDQHLWRDLQNNELNTIREQYNPEEKKRVLAQFLEGGIRSKFKHLLGQENLTRD
jgi:GT2 family glycosyltransferase